MGFYPSSLPDLTGYVALVTGGSSGLGLYTSLELAKHGARVYIAGRNEVAGKEAIKTIRTEAASADVRFLAVDLANLESVDACVKSFQEQESELHILVNNAGIMAPPYEETPQGFESQFGVNYISHFLLTKRLLPLLQSAAKAASKPGQVRIVNVSSFGHWLLPPSEGIVFNDTTLKSSNGTIWSRYGQSKLANILHAQELARRYGKSDAAILSISCHPGLVKTGLARGPLSSTRFYRWVQPLLEIGAPTARVGSYNNIFCAASPSLGLQDNGCYFGPVGVRAKPSRRANEKLARKLWDWTEEELAARGF